MSGKPLTQVQRDRIAELTETGRYSAGQIAIKVGCSAGAVAWNQLILGADRHPTRELPPIPTEPRVAMRGGRPVRAYTVADDALILSLEAQGFGPGQIGKRFSPPRLHNSIRGRLLTLARREARAEARAEAEIA